MRCFGSGKEKMGDSKKMRWTEWKRPVVVVVLTFLCNIESSMLAMGEWPYMSTIDHDAAAEFYGYANAANKAAHVICTFLFAFWAYKISSIKIPMLVGRIITLVACVMYIFVEFFPSNRRWWMLFCYLLFGVGFGTSPLLRSYIVRVTSEENRSSAFALLNGANVLSVMVGPMAQLAFSGLPYPGVEIIPPHIKLNVYSATVWVAIITNIIAICIIVFLLKDDDHVVEQRADDTADWSFSSMRTRLVGLRTLNLPWLLILLVLFVKMISGLFNYTMAATVGPLMTSMYAFSGEQIILVLGVSQIVVGFLAVGFSLSFVLCKIGNRVSCRVLFALSNILMIAGYVVTYSYPFTSTPMQPFNETTRTGCDPLEYSWCDSQLIVNVFIFAIVMIILSGFAIPSAMMSLDTIYSKMIGDIDQNIMQSFYGLVDDIMGIVAPIYATSTFTAIGFNYLEIINGSLYLLATVLWFAAWKKLRPFN